LRLSSWSQYQSDIRHRHLI